MKLSKNAYTWLSEKLGIPIDKIIITKMKGSTSSSIYLIKSEETNQRFVLRLFDNPDWLKEEPDIVVHEWNTLKEIQQLKNVSCPEPIAYDLGNVGFDVPVMIMSLIEGEVVLKPVDVGLWIKHLAHQLALIHQHQAENFPWAYKTWVDKNHLFPPAWSSKPHLWKKALDFYFKGAPTYRSVFLHRDYHPTNVLWKGDKISGVVDWSNGCQGPAGVDVGHCRANLALMYGIEENNSENSDNFDRGNIPQQFLKEYAKAAKEFVYDPYWDLDTIFDMCLPEPPFYKPWQEFGLDIIPSQLLQKRIEDYLECVMKNF